MKLLLVFPIVIIMCISCQQANEPTDKIAIDVQEQYGYFDAPYLRYESEEGTLSENAVMLKKSLFQHHIQSEATDQICALLKAPQSSISFTIKELAQGMVVRYSVPDGESASLQVLVNDQLATTLALTSYWSWEYLSKNGNPNNVAVTNEAPRMYFDEVRYLFPDKINKDDRLKLRLVSGQAHIDFIELEDVPPALVAEKDWAVYQGNGSDLNAFLSKNGGKTIFLPSGKYQVDTTLYFNEARTTLQGAGMWYTEINYSKKEHRMRDGGLSSKARDVSYRDIYFTSENNSRSLGCHLIRGIYTAGSEIRNVWAEHFIAGTWIGTKTVVSDSFLISNCRIRNTYADGIHLSSWTKNAVVEHCNIRNTGDDAMAIWSGSTGNEPVQNTFRYNTVENTWRACGMSIYSGKSHHIHHIIIKDNNDVGIRIANNFNGSGFDKNGLHHLHDIKIYSCSSDSNVFSANVPAIDIACFGEPITTCEPVIRNVKFSNIEIYNARNNAIRIFGHSGKGFDNISFEAVKVDGTGLKYAEVPNNKASESGYFVYFEGNPKGEISMSNMQFMNQMGNATSAMSAYNQDSLRLTLAD